MTSYIKLSILFLGVLFLAGCGQEQTNQTQSTTQVAPATQQQVNQPQKDANIPNQQTNSKNEQPKISEDKEWGTYYNQNIGIKFLYPDFFENTEENKSDSGITTKFIYPFNTQSAEKNSFYSMPTLRFSIINNKTINDPDYQTQYEWQKITKTWKIGGQNAIFIENREAGIFDMVVIENPLKQNSVIEFYSQNGLVNGKDFVVDLNKIVESIEFIK